MIVLYLYTGEVLTKKVDIQLPDIVIEGSARASVSVLGKLIN